MNKERRAALAALVQRIEEVVSEAETLRDEEQEYFDNMPEAFQDGERGQAAEAAAEAIDEAINQLEEAVEALNRAAE